MGSYLFSPPHLGRVILEVSFPVVTAQQSAISFEGPGWPWFTKLHDLLLSYLPREFVFFLGHPGDTLGETSAAMVLAGAVFLIWARWIRWEVGAVYVLTEFLLSPVFGRSLGIGILSGRTLLAGFFMVTDPVTTPMTRTGRILFAIGTALLTVIFRTSLSYFVAFSFAMLIMNALTPWLDVWVQPKGSRLASKIHRAKSGKG